MASKVRDWPSVTSVALSIVIAICTAAAAWGASRSELSAAEKDIVSIQIQIEKSRDKLNSLEIQQATTLQALTDIAKRLEEIQTELNRLNRSIEAMWKNKHSEGSNGR